MIPPLSAISQLKRFVSHLSCYLDLDYIGKEWCGIVIVEAEGKGRGKSYIHGLPCEVGNGMERNKSKDQKKTEKQTTSVRPKGKHRNLLLRILFRSWFPGP